DGARVVRVVAELSRQVERDAQSGLPALEQVAEARVRLLRRREAGVLANRPRPAAVHVGVRAARERELAGKLELVRRVGVGVDRLDLDAGLGLAAIGRGHAADATSRAPAVTTRSGGTQATRARGCPGARSATSASLSSSYRASGRLTRSVQASPP